MTIIIYVFGPTFGPLLNSHEKMHDLYDSRSHNLHRVTGEATKTKYGIWYLTCTSSYLCSIKPNKLESSFTFSLSLFIYQHQIPSWLPC
jgi:hypothetical protein